MSHRSILWAAMLVVVIAAVGLSVALAGASIRSGSHAAASWVNRAEPGPDASWLDGSGDSPDDTSV